MLNLNFANRHLFVEMLPETRVKVPMIELQHVRIGGLSQDVKSCQRRS
jgi:hypothetical protein